MKALKTVLIATIVSFAFMSFAESPTHPEKKDNEIKITLEQALTNPGLVCAMYQQLTPALLRAEQPGLYVGIVKYRFKVIRISGTREGWVEFFRNKPNWAPSN